MHIHYDKVIFQKTRLYGCLYNLLINDILDTHKYLTKKHDTKYCLDLFKT